MFPLADTPRVPLESTLTAVFLTTTEELFVLPDLIVIPLLPVPLSVTTGDVRVAALDVNPSLEVPDVSVLRSTPLAEIILVLLLLISTVLAVTSSSVPVTLVLLSPSFTVSETLLRVIPSLFRTILLLSLVL